MIAPKYVATKDLFQALIEAKRAFGRSDEHPEEAARTADDDASTTSHEGRLHEHE